MDDVRECEETSHLHAVRSLLLHYYFKEHMETSGTPRHRAAEARRLTRMSWLMGVSGEAFGYFYHPWGSCFSCFVNHHGHDPTVVALRASGLRGSWLWQRAPSAGTGQAALRQAAEALRMGCTVLAPGVVPTAVEPTNSQCGRFFVVPIALVAVSSSFLRTELMGGRRAGIEGRSRLDAGVDAGTARGRPPL